MSSRPLAGGGKATYDGSGNPRKSGRNKSEVCDKHWTVVLKDGEPDVTPGGTLRTCDYRGFQNIVYV